MRQLSALLLTATLAFSAAPVLAQSADVSPVLLIETGPSDNADYRRMVYVKYLSGNFVSVNYAAYNRTEFIQRPTTTSADIVSACANGAPTPLSQIRAYQRAEAERKRRNQPPEVVRFCIKNVPNWEGGGRTLYTDPIFDGMPHAAALNN